MRVLVAAACILMLLYGLRLIFLQLVNGDDFKSQATNTTDYKFTVTAARGDIVDSRGERIATSVTGYNVVLNKLLMGDEDLDGMLQKPAGCRGQLYLYRRSGQHQGSESPCRHEGQSWFTAVRNGQ